VVGICDKQDMANESVLIIQIIMFCALLSGK